MHKTVVDLNKNRQIEPLWHSPQTDPCVLAKKSIIARYDDPFHQRLGAETADGDYERRS